MIAKLGGEEAYKEWRKNISKKGGGKKVPKGMAKMTKEKLRDVTSKGGIASGEARRNSKR